MNISIITVTWNDVENLKKTFVSLNAQTNKDFEWIIKDGKSSDNTVEIYERLIKPSSLNVKFIARSDRSVYEAMNQAIKETTNQFILFLNAGDTLESHNTLDKVINAIKTTHLEYSFIYGDVIDVTSKGEQIYKKAREISYLSNSIPTSHQSIFYNKTLLNKYNYDLSYKIAADYALTAQIYFDGNDKYLKLDFPISKFSLGGISTTRRNILLKEGYHIHRHIVKDNILRANFKLVKRYATFFILDNFPNVYRFIRNMIDRNYQKTSNYSDKDK